MNKRVIILLLIIVLFGCSATEETESEELKAYYETFEELKESDHFLASSQHYDSELVVNTIDDGYRLDLIIDNPKIAMYDIQIMLEINPDQKHKDHMVNPSIGVVDQKIYHLLPNQVNKDENFYKGLVISGQSQEASGRVIAMIKWSDYARTQEFVEFIEYHYGDDKNE